MSNLVSTKLHSIYRVTSADQVWDYSEMINMDQASTSLKYMMMLSNDSGCCVLELHQVYLQNPSIYIWVNFVILVLTCVMANFVIMGIGLIYM